LFWGPAWVTALQRYTHGSCEERLAGSAFSAKGDGPDAFLKPCPLPPPYNGTGNPNPDRGGVQDQAGRIAPVPLSRAIRFKLCFHANVGLATHHSRNAEPYSRLTWVVLASNPFARGRLARTATRGPGLNSPRPSRRVTVKTHLLPRRRLRSFSPQKIFAQFIFSVGKHRIAFDFTSRVTRLPDGTGDQPARVLPITNKRGKSSAS